MTTQIVDLERVRGDTRRHTFKIADDISNWRDFFLAVNLDDEPTDTLNQVELMPGTLTTDGTDGYVHFIPSGTIPAETYYYDAQAIDSNGEKITFVKGKYVVPQDRTKE